jgi:hypothetical protein
MIVLDAHMVTALAALFTSLSGLVWTVRRKR